MLARKNVDGDEQPVVMRSLLDQYQVAFSMKSPASSVSVFRTQNVGALSPSYNAPAADMLKWGISRLQSACMAGLALFFIPVVKYAPFFSLPYVNIPPNTETLRYGTERKESVSAAPKKKSRFSKIPH